MFIRLNPLLIVQGKSILTFDFKSPLLPNFHTICFLFTCQITQKPGGKVFSSKEVITGVTTWNNSIQKSHEVTGKCLSPYFSSFYTLKNLSVEYFGPIIVSHWVFPAKTGSPRNVFVAQYSITTSFSFVICSWRLVEFISTAPSSNSYGEVAYTFGRLHCLGVCNQNARFDYG